MGSMSDYEVMADAVAMLEQFGVEYEKRVVSAHRTPDLLCEYAKPAAADWASSSPERAVQPICRVWSPR